MSLLASNIPTTPLLDPDGRLNHAWQVWFRAVTTTLNAGFDPAGNYQGPIGAKATIVGRQFLATIVQHLTDAGLIEPAGLPAATPTEQGAVIMAAGAVNNQLGSAAQQASTAFDPAGSAATAQTNAQTFATGAASTAQNNAEIYADTQITAAFSAGLNVTITTAPLTGGGTTGSMTFTNGLLTAQTLAT